MVLFGLLRGEKFSKNCETSNRQEGCPFEEFQRQVWHGNLSWSNLTSSGSEIGNTNLFFLAQICTLLDNQANKK